MKKLNEIGNFRTGFVLSRYKSTEKNENKYKVMTLKSLDKYGNINKSEFDEVYLEKPADNEFLTKEGDIIIRLREPVIASTIRKEDENVLVPSLIVLLKITDKNVLPEYVSTYINSSEVKKSLVSRVSGTAIASVTIADLKEIEIKIPNIKIQKLIIDFSKNMKKQIKILEKLKNNKEIFYEENLKNILKKIK